jgi:hypothetical protein
MDNCDYKGAGMQVGNLGIAFRFPVGAKNVFLFGNVQTVCGIHPVLYSKVQEIPSSGVKRSQRESDHLPQSLLEVFLHSSANLVASKLIRHLP